MRNVIDNIDLPLEDLNILEVFGRDGSSNISHYYGKVKSVEIWEINPKYQPILRQKFPNAIIRIWDSIKTLEHYSHFFLYDMIVLDCPSQTYCGAKGEPYCECFDILPNIGKLFEKKTLLVMNVWDKTPDNITPLWQKKRDMFYGVDAHLITPEFLDSFYIEYFKKLGITVKMIKHIRRGETICYYMLYLEKTQ